MSDTSTRSIVLPDVSALPVISMSAKMLLPEKIRFDTRLARTSPPEPNVPMSPKTSMVRRISSPEPVPLSMPASDRTELSTSRYTYELDDDGTLTTMLLTASRDVVELTVITVPLPALVAVMATLLLPSTVYDTPDEGVAMTVMVARAPLDVMSAAMALTQNRVRDMDNSYLMISRTRKERVHLTQNRGDGDALGCHDLKAVGQLVIDASCARGAL